MDWFTILGIAAAISIMLGSGAVWKHIHKHQADHMHQYGDRERNKYGLWK